MTDLQRIQKGTLLTKVSLGRETVYLVFSPVGTDLFSPRLMISMASRVPRD